MNAAHRLIASELERVRTVENLYQDFVKKRVPAVLNKVDHTIGFRCDAPQVLRVLKNMGYALVHKDGTTQVLKNAEHQIQIREPHDGWNPVLRVLH